MVSHMRLCAIPDVVIKDCRVLSRNENQYQKVPSTRN